MILFFRTFFKFNGLFILRTNHNRNFQVVRSFIETLPTLYESNSSKSNCLGAALNSACEMIVSFIDFCITTMFFNLICFLIKIFEIFSFHIFLQFVFHIFFRSFFLFSIMLILIYLNFSQNLIFRRKLVVV